MGIGQYLYGELRWVPTSQGRATQVEEVTETEVKVDPVEKLCLTLALLIFQAILEVSWNGGTPKSSMFIVFFP